MIEKSFREMVHNLGGKGASISPFDIVHKKKNKKKTPVSKWRLFFWWRIQLGIRDARELNWLFVRKAVSPVRYIYNDDVRNITIGF